jgi:hypothetical protein
VLFRSGGGEPRPAGGRARHAPATPHGRPPPPGSPGRRPQPPSRPSPSRPVEAEAIPKTQTPTKGGVSAGGLTAGRSPSAPGCVTPAWPPRQQAGGTRPRNCPSDRPPARPQRARLWEDEALPSATGHHEHLQLALRVPAYRDAPRHQPRARGLVALLAPPGACHQPRVPVRPLDSLRHLRLGAACCRRRGHVAALVTTRRTPLTPHAQRLTIMACGVSGQYPERLARHEREGVGAPRRQHTHCLAREWSTGLEFETGLATGTQLRGHASVAGRGPSQRRRRTCPLDYWPQRMAREGWTTARTSSTCVRVTPTGTPPSQAAAH